MAALVPLILVGMIAWATAYQTFGPVLQLEERAARRTTDQPLAGPVLSKGLALLSTGTPPDNRYRCRFTVVREEVAIERQLTFTALGDATWVVSVASVKGLTPDCPDRFDEESGP